MSNQINIRNGIEQLYKHVVVVLLCLNTHGTEPLTLKIRGN